MAFPLLTDWLLLRSLADRRRFFIILSVELGLGDSEPNLEQNNDQF